MLTIKSDIRKLCLHTQTQNLANTNSIKAEIYLKKRNRNTKTVRETLSHH